MNGNTLSGTFELDSKLELLRGRKMGAVNDTSTRLLQTEYDHRFEISWIYHDSALEGVVLTYSEIKASIDKKIISDVSLIPSYQEIKQFKAAIDWAAELAHNKKKPINLDTIRTLYGIVDPEEHAKDAPYRKENPLHRLYYHDIAQPDKIAPRMKKLGEWMDEEADRLPPIERAAMTHHKLMGIFPWIKNTGRVARLLANAILMRHGYLPAIIHAIDRQKYYEGLKGEGNSLLPLYVEAVSTSVETALKFYDEATLEFERRAS